MPAPPEALAEADIPSRRAARRLHMKARERLHAGRHAEAAELLRRVLAIDPRHAESLHLLGVALYAEGRHAAAADALTRAVALRPDVGHYWNNLGNALRDTGRLDEAVHCLRRAVELAPDLPAAHCNLATALLRVDRPDEAEAAYARAFQLQPTLTDAAAGLAAIHLYRGRLTAAVHWYERALALEPRRADLHNDLGYAQHRLGDHDAAVAAYRRALDLDPAAADAFNNLGFTLQATGRSDEAVTCYERALELRPAFAEAANNLGNALRDCGRFADALAAYDRALRLRPDYADAHYNRADVHRFRRGDRELAELERLAAAGPAARDSALVQFALGKALDEIGEHDRAFAAWTRANALKRAEVRYDEAALECWFARVRAVFTPELLAGGADGAAPDERPVFIVGMPRSGTTLVEQILASHPAVRTMGETDLLERAAATLVAAAPDGGTNAAIVAPAEDYPESIRTAPRSLLAAVGRDYLDGLRIHGGAERVLDKRPGNFVHLGLIRLALPGARIVHVRREPLDTCLSCYTKHFASGHEFCYDLAELGRQHRRYSALMAYWRTLLPSAALFEIAYEDVVADLEGSARRLVEFCGLPWDERCLAFHAGSRVVTTASAVQVRRPVYSASVERWRPYATHLAPLIEALGT